MKNYIEKFLVKYIHIQLKLQTELSIKRYDEILSQIERLITISPRSHYDTWHIFYIKYNNDYIKYNNDYLNFINYTLLVLDKFLILEILIFHVVL